MTIHEVKFTLQARFIVKLVYYEYENLYAPISHHRSELSFSSNRSQYLHIC